MTRQVWYISGTRADFGLMRSTLVAIDEHRDLDLSILVSGMHLDPDFGLTVAEIEESGFRIAAKVPAKTGARGGAAMAHGIALMVEGFTAAMEAGSPDLILLLGDRGEMLAGAIAAIHLNIPIVHIHGGERSGTVDEPVRHAISKLSHVHLTSTQDAASRLKRMGEREDMIHVVGAPGLVGLSQQPLSSRAELCRQAGLDETGKLALFLYHPVLQEAESGGKTAAAILDELLRRGFQIMALRPNSDSGYELIGAELEKRRDEARIRVATHLPRAAFVSWMAHADLMIGNSSSGIIEAASFGTPVINIGSRQTLRERNRNVIDVAGDRSSIASAIDSAIDQGRFPASNIYGDGKSDSRIAALLAELTLKGLTEKVNSY